MPPGHPNPLIGPLELQLTCSVRMQDDDRQILELSVCRCGLSCPAQDLCQAAAKLTPRRPPAGPVTDWWNWPVNGTELCHTCDHVFSTNLPWTAVRCEPLSLFGLEGGREQADPAGSRSSCCGVGVMMVIDLFSKRLSIVPIRSKLQDDVLAGPIEGIHKMGEKPELFCSDDEGSLNRNSNVLKEYIEEQGMEMYGITQNSNTSGVSRESQSNRQRYGA